jgi:Methionine synthase II (cobalamin-independent)
MASKLPLLYTHVMGSHGFPGWFWTALDKIKADEYGATDVRETFDDATQLAIRDQERAGIDVICDGEMRRFFFVQTFYGKMDGLETLEPLRKTGLYAYDSVPRYRATRKVTVPKGLGTVDEFKYLKTQTDKPIKAPAPARSPCPSTSRRDRATPTITTASPCAGISCPPSTPSSRPSPRRARTGSRSTSPRRPSCPARPPST